ncbi:MAG: AMP-binding protein [bacterium]
MSNAADLYNIALDCVDKHASVLQNKHKVALLYLKEDPATGHLREPPLRLSYASLQGLTNAMANAFAGLGLPRGSRVVLRLANSAEFPISFLGAVKAGLIPIPTSIQLTWPELEFILRDSAAAALVAGADLLPKELLSNRPPLLREILWLSEKGQELPEGVRRWQDLLKAADAQFQTEPTAADSPAFWLYTSGTEGRPKAVIHAHRSIRAHDARARLWQDLRAGDVVFNTSALNWSYALTCGMLDVWRHGLTSVVYQGRLSPELLSQIVRRHGVTTLMTVPGIYRRLLPYLREREGALAGLRVCLSAGEKLADELRAGLQAAMGLEIREGLGMTEHSVYLVQGQDSAPISGSCGQALPGQRIAVLREDLSECKPGETGILASHRSCEGLMLGYHARPEEEAGAFRGEWFLSGDLATRDEAGNFFFLGRRDDVLTSGGYRVSPMEVEAALNAHPAVAESAAVNVELEPGKTLIEAFVVLHGGHAATQSLAQEILASAATRLAAYKVPRQVVFLRELPKTANGKLRRQALAKPGG